MRMSYRPVNLQVLWTPGDNITLSGQPLGLRDSLWLPLAAATWMLEAGRRQRDPPPASLLPAWTSAPASHRHPRGAAALSAAPGLPGAVKRRVALQRGCDRDGHSRKRGRPAITPRKVPGNSHHLGIEGGGAGLRERWRVHALASPRCPGKLLKRPDRCRLQDLIQELGWVWEAEAAEMQELGWIQMEEAALLFPVHHWLELVPQPGLMARERLPWAVRERGAGHRGPLGMSTWVLTPFPLPPGIFSQQCTSFKIAAVGGWGAGRGCVQICRDPI